MGLKRGEKLQKLAVIRVVSAKREVLAALTHMYVPSAAMKEVEREGFPGMTAEEFVKMFCEHMKCAPQAVVTRIEFEYV